MAQPRLVIVDPSHAGSVGHHNEVNRPLLATLQQAGWQAELWADVALEAEADAPHPLLGAFSGCGYGDPRHWADLNSMVNLAKRLEQQLQQAAATRPPAQAWLGHSLLPFQLLGLARHLASAPPAAVLLSLMFAPAETLGGPRDGAQATANSRIALAALARAAELGGHRLQLVFPSRQQEQLHAPLLQATGLRSAGVHPAVVGAGCRPQPPTPGSAPLVLLHWGDLKAGKGHREALGVLAELVAEGVPAPLHGWGWLFHSHSHKALDSEERSALEQAAAAGLELQWLNGAQTSSAMVNLLARCPLALLAYDPELYAQRSSGMLWQWAAARLALQLPAAAVGHTTGWLAEEAPLLGIPWSTPTAAGSWLTALAAAATALPHEANSSGYADRVLQESFGLWCGRQLTEQH